MLVEERITSQRDRVFKEIFSQSKNKDLLQAILETCLRTNINNIKYLNVELPQGHSKVKGKRLDLLLDTEKGKINVEVNAAKNKYLNPRNFAYICNVYIRNTLVGSQYTEDINIIQINLTYGIKKEALKREYYVMNAGGEKYIRNFKIIEINMDKVLDFWYCKNKRMIDKYKYLIMLGLSRRELDKFDIADERVEKYKMELGNVTVSFGINDWIDEETDQRMIRNSLISEGVEKGMKKGIKQGMKQGIEQGLKQGIEQGVEQNTRNVVKALYEMNDSIEKIAKVTGITEKEVMEIIDSLKESK